MAQESFVLVQRKYIRQAVTELKQATKQNSLEKGENCCSDLVDEFEKILKKGKFVWR